MANQRVSDDKLQKVVDTLQKHGVVGVAAEILGISPRTMQRHNSIAISRGFRPKGFDYDPLPSPERSLKELKEARRGEWKRKHKAEEARRLIQVRIKIDGPIGIAHFGDPHVDDPGTDFDHLERDVEIVGKTEGMFGANVGDLQNNWVGRLARLYGDQATTAKEAWLLTEWLATAIPWLYIIAGNHDLWSGNGDPLDFIARQHGTIYEEHGARIGFKFPNGKEVRTNCRHDFRGHSQWNTVHSVSKAAQMGWRDHILTAGHKHISGYTLVKDPASGLISHAIRIAGYKKHDTYGTRELGLPDQNIFPTAVTIIDPIRADDDPRLVTTLFDVEQAAEFLTWLRRKK